jgi:hypothetical protein
MSDNDDVGHPHHPRDDDGEQEEHEKSARSRIVCGDDRSIMVKKGLTAEKE